MLVNTMSGNPKPNHYQYTVGSPIGVSPQQSVCFLQTPAEIGLVKEERVWITKSQTAVDSPGSVATSPDDSCEYVGSSSDSELQSLREGTNISGTGSPWSTEGTRVASPVPSESSSSDSEWPSLCSTKSLVAHGFGTKSLVAHGFGTLGNLVCDLQSCEFIYKSPPPDLYGVNQGLAEKLICSTLQRAQKVLERRSDRIDPSVAKALQQYIETAGSMHQGVAEKDHMLAMIEYVEPLLESVSTHPSILTQTEVGKGLASSRIASSLTKPIGDYGRKYVDLADGDTEAVRALLGVGDAKQYDECNNTQFDFSETQSMSLSEIERWNMKTAKGVHADAAAITGTGPLCPCCGKCLGLLNEDQIAAHLDVCHTQGDNEQKLVMKEEMPNIASLLKKSWLPLTDEIEDLAGEIEALAGKIESLVEARRRSKHSRSKAS